MREKIDELFVTEMSRKEFLQHIASGLLIAFGISGLLKALTQPRQQARAGGMGYGSSAYGGTKR